MIDKVKITNLSTQQSIQFSKEASNAYLIEDNGLNWGEADAIHNTYTNLTGLGKVITSTRLDSRPVSLTGRVSCVHTNKEIAEIYGVTKLSEILSKKLEEIEASKKLLSQVINPLHYIRIEAGRYYIDGKPNSSVIFSDKDKENNEIYCRFTASFTCNNPLFQYDTKTETPLSGTYGGFHFPLHIPKPNGMKFGRILSFQLVSINNSGDTALGGVITIKARGTVNSPIFTNVYTQESLTVHKTLEEGEVIKIDTVNRKIVGATDGEHFENYFSYWDFDNTWFQFPVGDTLFGFSTADGTYKNMETWVEINQSYYSMENQ